MNHNKIYKPALWMRFRKNTFALSGLVFICITLFISILGYIICPDSTPFSNQQYLQLTAKRPGFSANMLLVRRNKEFHKKKLFGRMLFGQDNIYKGYPYNKIWFEGNKVCIEEYSDIKGDEKFITCFHLADVVFPVIKKEISTNAENTKVHFIDINQNKRTYNLDNLRTMVSQHHLVRKKFFFGTDRFGRDLLSRIILGTRISFSVGFISVFLSLVIGITLGAIAGYFKGLVDKIVMWLINVVWTIPTLLMVIAITFMLGKGFWQVFIAVGLTMWVEVARIVRGQVLSIREKEYIEACRALAYTDRRIIIKHILPNIVGPIIIISAANFASAILLEAGLSFLGIGVQPPMPSWGALIKDHYGFIIVNQGYLAFIPGTAIMLLVLSFTLVGNGLRDAMDYNPSKAIK